jgi:transposase
VATASAEVERLLQQSPRRYRIERSCWRLQDVGCALTWLEGLSVPGIYKVLKRLGFSRKQALDFIRSPDPAYRAKWQRILAAYQEAWTNPEQVVLLFLDELTYYRQPTKSKSWHRQGGSQPKAQQAPRYNTKTRLVAVLNAVTGQVDYLQRSTVGQDALLAFYAQIRAAYPGVAHIYVAQDNWPVHKLDPVLAAAAAQQVTPLFLPTYASWLNPIEKLWRWLKQEVIHLHTWAHEEKLTTLRQQVCDFLDKFTTGSLNLLHYVGILSREEMTQTTGLNC